MNCLIVDDNQMELAAARHLVNMDPSLNLIAVCENATDAFQRHLDQPVDLLILDIEMPDVSGIELVQSLDEKRPMVIFMTSGPEYAVQAFDLNVVDFITKPIAPIRFLQAIAKAKELKKAKDLLLKSEDDEFIFIRDSNIIRKVKLNEILYLEAMGDNVKICLSNITYSIHSTMKAVEQKLNPRDFLRIHRSFIINISKIDIIEGGMVIMEKIMVPVSDAYRSILNRRMQVF